MPLQPIAELTASSPDTGLYSVAELGSGRLEERLDTVAKPISSEPAPYRYPALLARVFRALVDPDGYDAGLRRLDEDLRRRGPSQFARFYIEELLGRSPDTAVVAQEIVLSPSRRIREILSSNEFMAQHDIVLQREFAHLSREFFFHIPKSGGTTVFEAFRSDSRFCPIHLFRGYDNGWFAERLGYLRNTILRLTDPHARHMFVYGHPSATRMLSNNLKRGWDTAFTILRDPIDACLSWINYVLTLVATRPTHPDVIRWRNSLGMAEEPFVSDRSAVIKLVPRIVELIVPSNPICGILGIEPCLESVLDTAAILDLKIIRFEQIDEFIRFRGITRHERRNVSTRHIEFSDLDQGIRLAMYEKSSEDIKLFDWVSRHAHAGDGPWFEL
jgi:hypothetical protein